MTSSRNNRASSQGGLIERGHNITFYCKCFVDIDSMKDVSTSFPFIHKESAKI